MNFNAIALRMLVKDKKKEVSASYNSEAEPTEAQKKSPVIQHEDIQSDIFNNEEMLTLTNHSLDSKTMEEKLNLPFLIIFSGYERYREIKSSGSTTENSRLVGGPMHISELISSFSNNILEIELDSDAVAPKDFFGKVGVGNNYVTDGCINKLDITSTSIRETLEKILKPLNLEMEIQPDSIYITTSIVTDLKVSDDGFMLVTHSEDGLYQMQLNIVNDTEETIPQFDAFFFKGVEDLWEPMLSKIGPIQPGKEWNAETQPFALEDSRHKVSVILDPSSRILERNKDNNHVAIEALVRDGEVIESELKIGRIRPTLALLE